MRIVTYTCLDGDAPKGSEAIARLLETTRDHKGRAVERQMPIIIYASTAEEAREKAQAWWDAETAKAQRRLENASAAILKRAAKVEHKRKAF